MNVFVKKILIVHNYYQIPGGEDTVVLNEKRLLEEHGHKVYLYSRNNSEIKEMSVFRKLLLPLTTIFNPKTYCDIRHLISEMQPDVIHVHNTLNLISPAVYYAAWKSKVPVVQTMHNFRLLCPGATFYRDGHICEDCVEYGLHCAVKHGCYRNSRLQTLLCVISTKLHRMTGIYGKLNYICLTEFNKEKLSFLKQIKKDKVFIKPNFGEDDETFIPADQREDYFVFAGRLDKLKGIDVLLKMWQQMGKTAPQLVVCGTGPMEKWCKEFVSVNVVNAELRGYVSNLEVRKLIANSKALILPTQWYEGFPMSIVEAFSVGTPVICSDLGNAGNMVIDGINGYKFKNNLLVCVDKIMQSLQIYETTRMWYKKKYTSDINYKSMMEIYRKIQF